MKKVIVASQEMCDKFPEVEGIVPNKRSPEEKPALDNKFVQEVPQKKARKQFMKNPLRKVDGNAKCICGSGETVKECCGKAKLVPREWGKEVEQVVKSYLIQKRISERF